MVSAPCVCSTKIPKGNLKWQIIVRRMSRYFGSFAGRGNRLVPYFKAFGNVMSMTPLEHCGARSVFGHGCSVCQLYVEGSESVLPSTSSRNQFPSFYPTPMPNPLSNQTQLLQFRMKAAYTFLVSDDYSVAFNTLYLNMPAFLLDPLLVFLLKWRLCDDDNIISLI